MITDDPSKKGNYIFNWLNEIFSDIFNEVSDTVNDCENKPKTDN